MRVGILGGGQLAQMLALAGIPLGIRFVCLEPQPNCAASSVAHIIEDDYNESSIKQLASMVDVLTFESENIPTKNLQDPSLPLYPSLKALEIAQDRLLEKQFFSDLGLSVAEFFPVDHLQDLSIAFEKLGFPLLLKTRRQGYDGKGQYLIRSKEEAEVAFRALSSGASSSPLPQAGEGLGVRAFNNALIAEKWIGFDREVSLIAVRSLNGQINFYPLTENLHQGGILRLSKAPYLDETLTLKAQACLKLILEKLNYVGVLAIEFFVLGNELLINEMAPRVHNSGHWTIEAAQTSQFENHLRAILNWPLGASAAIGYSAMVNFISEPPILEQLLKIPSLHVHLYGKAPKIGRKLGHMTFLSKKRISQQKYRFLLSL